MRLPETIQKLIEKEEKRLSKRVKGPRVSAGSLNRDVDNITHRIHLLQDELKESEAYHGQGWKVKQKIKEITNVLHLIAAESDQLPLDVALLCLKPIENITRGVWVELLNHHETKHRTSV